MLSLGNKLTLNTQPIYKFVNEHSVQFDGATQKIVTDGADTVLQNTTYSFWVKSTKATSNFIFGHGSYNIGAFQLNSGGTVPLLYLGASYKVYWSDIPQQDDGEWHHWVLYQDVDNVLNSKLYCDGVLQTVTSTTAGAANAYTESLTIGCNKITGGDFFLGKIDEFAVFDRELTQAEITRMYNTYYSPNRVANGNFSQEGVEEVTNGDFSQIGSELLTNGDFSSGSGWNGSISVAGGQGTKTSAGLAYQSGIITSGKQYKIVVDVASLDGATQIYAGGNGSGAISVGVQTIYMTGGSSNSFLGLNNGYVTGVGSVFNSISVKEVGQDWTADSNWTIDQANNKAISDGSQSGNVSLRQSNSIMGLTTGSFYKVEFTISNYSAGQINPHVRGNASGNVNGNGVKTSYIAAGSGSDGINLYSNLDFAGDISNISVKEVGQHWTLNGTATISDGKAHINSPSGELAEITQTGSLVIGRNYRLTCDLDKTSGDTQFVNGGTFILADGFNTINFTANSTNVYFKRGAGSVVSSLDNIVVQELKHDATNLMLNAGAYQSANPLITSTKSMEFDPTDYLSVSDSDDLDIGTNDFSVSAWVKTTVADGTVLAKRNGSVSGGAGYEMGLSNGKVSWYFKDAAGNAAFDTEDTVTVNDGKWHHIAWVFDRSGLGYRYIDGVNSGTNDSLTGAAGSLANTDVALGIGARIQASADNFFTGKITEAGIYNRALTSLEVASLYNQGMPTNLLVNRNNYQSGNPTVFNTKQVDFDGVDDHLKVTNAYGSFTGSISFWVNRDNNTGHQFLYDARGAGNTGTGFAYVSNGTDNIQVSSGTIYVDGVATAIVPTDGNWHNVVITGITLDVTEDITFGSTYNVINELNGKMSQVGLWNTTLTADEVSSLYNHGLPIDLTTDQAAYASSSNLVGYWRMGSGTLDTYPLIADQTNATLGSELITNGDFANGTTGWTTGNSGVLSIVDGALVVTGDGGSFASAKQIVTGVVGKTYKLTGKVAVVSGSYNVRVEADQPSWLNLFTTSSTDFVNFEAYFVCVNTSIDLRFTIYNATTTSSDKIKIDDISLKELGGNPAMMINLGGGADFSDGIKNGSPYANTVTNGTFATDSDWSKGTGWSILNGEAVCSSGSGNLQQDVSVTANRNYKVTFEVTDYTSGTLYVDLGGSTAQTTTSTGNKIFYFTTTSTNNLRFYGGAFSGSIDNVTVEEVNTGLQGYWKMGDGTNDEYPVIYDQVDPTLSSELVTNGDFATDLSGWSGQAGRGSYAWDNGRAKITNDDASSYPNLSQSINTNIGKVYKITATVEIGTATLTEVRAYSNSNIGSQQLTTDGTIEFYITADDTDFTLHLYLFETGNTGHYCYFDNVSVKEVQGNPAYMTNMVEGNITNQYPLTKIRNYYRMGDGILDGYPIIQDQTSPNLAHIPTTNIVPYSEDLSQWTIANGTLTPNATVSPDGTQNADKVVFSNTGLDLKTTVTVVAGQRYTISFYIKLESGTGLQGRFYDNSNSTNIEYYTYTSQVQGTEWSRVTRSVTAPSGCTEMQIWLLAASSSLVTASFWGAQFEAQSQATVYLKSDGIAAVRKSSTTNLISYSEDFTQSSWQKFNLTPLSNTIISPDGNTNSTTFTKPLSGVPRLFLLNIYPTTGVYTFSVFIKNIDCNSILLRLDADNNTANCDINLSNNTLVNTGSNIISSNLTEFANGWIRVSVTGNITSTALKIDALNMFNSTVGTSVAIWGAQLEQQTQAETYAPTYGLPVTIDLFTENNYGTMTNMSASDIVEDTP